MSHLDIYSDIACPWCFIGKRRLEAALTELPAEQRPTIRWHAYQLNPDFPAGHSVSALDYLEKKFGGAARLAPMKDRVQSLASDVGIAMEFAHQRSFNTRLAHRAVAIARSVGQEDAVVEALFVGQFVSGADFSDTENVARVLEAAGVSDAGARLERGEGNDDVDADLRAAAAVGITGVPFFILDERLGLSGAQDKETFVEFLRS